MCVPVRADLQRLQRQSQVVDRARRAGEVVDDVHRPLDLEVTRDVVADEGERLAAKVLHVVERACLEIVDADDPVTLGNEGVAEVRTEKACASGDDGGRHLASMLPRPREARGSLHKGFTASSAVSVARMRWWGPLGLLAAIRVAIPLAAFAHEGSSLPGMPAFVRSKEDGGLTGDATGFYAATREFMAAWGRMPRIVLALDALFALAAAALIVVLWRRRADLRPWLAAAALCAFGLVVAVDVHWMNPSGAAVFGWPLLWALPMTAYRALGFGPQQARRVGLRLRALAARRRRDGRRGRVPRAERDGTPAARAARRRLLDRVASPRRPDRRASRLDERAVGGRRRPAQLQRAALDVARHRRSSAPALAAADGASPRARRLRAERGNARQALERTARSRCASGRVPPWAHARDAAVSRRRARARAARRDVLADLVSEAVRQPTVVAARPVRHRTRRDVVDALVDLRSAHAR